MTENTLDGTEQELEEAIDEIKRCWQKGEYFEMPGPIERARSLVSELGDEPNRADDHDREDCIRGYTAVHDLYPWGEIRERAIDDAADGLEQFDVPEDEVEIRHAMLEGGVLHYKLEHENIPTIDYGCSVDPGVDRND